MNIGSTEWKMLVADGAAELGNEIGIDAVEQLAIYAQELVTWNKRMNLTAVTDPRDVAIKHFIDASAPAADLSRSVYVMDIGSGGGFPGIVLKVIKPSLKMTLIDASRKKVSFLKHIIRTLRLTHCDAIHTRAETLAQNPNYINTYDAVVCRAVSNVATIVSWALPFLTETGHIIAMKGKHVQPELDEFLAFRSKDAAALNVETRFYNLPYSTSKRTMVVITRKRPAVDSLLQSALFR